VAKNRSRGCWATRFSGLCRQTLSLPRFPNASADTSKHFAIWPARGDQVRHQAWIFLVAVRASLESRAGRDRRDWSTGGKNRCWRFWRSCSCNISLRGKALEILVAFIAKCPLTKATETSFVHSIIGKPWPVDGAVAAEKKNTRIGEIRGDHPRGPDGLVLSRGFFSGRRKEELERVWSAINHKKGRQKGLRRSHSTSQQKAIVQQAADQILFPNTALTRSAWHSAGPHQLSARIESWAGMELEGGNKLRRGPTSTAVAVLFMRAVAVRRLRKQKGRWASSTVASLGPRPSTSRKSCGPGAYTTNQASRACGGLALTHSFQHGPNASTACAPALPVGPPKSRNPPPPPHPSNRPENCRPVWPSESRPGQGCCEP